MTHTAIQTRRLSKQFGPLRAVQQLEMTVEEGEVFGFLGPNGAGKTTTIRMLLDFLRPSSGEATVLDGRGGDPAIRRRIGYLPADLTLPRGYTGNDVIELFGALRGGVDRRWVDVLVERFGLDPGRTIDDLSTGNRRKVGIVQAFMHRPDLLILDEPTSGLDPLLQHEFYRLIGEAAADGATVFISSHVLPEVERVAHRVGILRAGQMVAVATVDELRQRARQRIALHVVGDADGERFRELPGVVEVTSRAGVIELVVEGSADAVVKAAATLEVERIVSQEADLDEIFLDFYREDDAE